MKKILNMKQSTLQFSKGVEKLLNTRRLGLIASIAGIPTGFILAQYSVIGYGVAAFFAANIIGIGVLFILEGFGFRFVKNDDKLVKKQ